MSDTLTQLITKIQDLLDDDGTIFSTDTCTAGIRKALAKFNEIAPVNSADIIDAVSDQYEYELSDTDPSAMYITDILLEGDNQNEIDTPLEYDQYSEDERLFFRLRTPQETGDYLIARYTTPHTINGLDSETESTIPTWQNEIIVIGGAANALLTRAFARVATINLNKEVSENYKELSKIYMQEFMASLIAIGKKKKPAVGEKPSYSWSIQ
jgi:hypothetical protein